jgi:hypothetical protein
VCLEAERDKRDRQSSEKSCKVSTVILFDTLVEHVIVGGGNPGNPGILFVGSSSSSSPSSKCQ